MAACAWKWSYSYEAMDAIVLHALNTLRYYFTVLVQLH